MMPNVDKIIAFEEGTLDARGTVELFAGLVRSGLVWSLQGSYGRYAADLIEGGVITPEGEITAHGYALTEEDE